MNNKKNRKEIRRTMMIYLNCVDLKTSEDAGKIVDITNEGFMLMSEKAVSVGKKTDYRIELPNFKEFSNIKFQVEGICRWIRKDDLQELFYMGISFTELNPEYFSIIELLINKIGFSNGQKKIFTAAGDIEYK